MAKTETQADFGSAIAKAYTFEGAALDLGRGVHSGELVKEAVVRVPLSMVNRHGLIAGATGTGKTKTLQGLAEQLSAGGVPVVAADMKGDVSGLATPGDADGPAAKRDAELGIDYKPESFPVEYLSLGGIGQGVPVRATVSDFGPQLLAKVLSANETQEQSLSLVFRFADDKGLPLLELSDLRSLLQYLSSGQGKTELEGLGGVSKQTIGVLLRALSQLEEGGGNEFFGEPQLAIADLLRTAEDGRGVISVLELPAVQDKRALFSTALMWLLAELFEELPEVGDLPKPKLVFFFDEAHLLFDGAPKALMDKIEQVVRLIRSKGVGVYFVTQNPIDVPDKVLAQLGNRVQHALRAFTPRDQKAVRAAAEMFRANPKLDTETIITQLGKGEALVSFLEGNGTPSMVERCMVRPPTARIGPVTPEERSAVIKKSPVKGKYDQAIDSQSAYEVLTQRTAETAAPPATGGKGNVPTAGGAQEGDAGGGLLGNLDGMLGSIFGTSRPRGTRLSTGQLITREVTRSVTNKFAGQIAANIGKSIGGSMGGSVGRAIVRGTLGGILRR